MEKNTAPRVNRGGGNSGNAENLSNSSNNPSRRLDQAYLDELEIIANWRVDLTARINRAQLRYEAVGLSPESIIELGEEARDFAAACQWLRGEFAP